jgi:8-amino-7-oxononanoate synthase
MTIAPFSWIDDELRGLRNDSLLRERRIVHPAGPGRCRIEGTDAVLVDFSSNDYLGLAMSPSLRDAAIDAIRESGVGARASALVSGTHGWHERLRRTIADFEGADDALLFPTGYAANVGTISALAGPGDTVFCDRLNHASLVDGCRLSRARFRVYAHKNIPRLERELKKSKNARRRLIVTDGVFSMDGDLAPIDELWELAQHYDATLLVDEAHATGVFGEVHFRGAVEHFGLDGRPIIRVGTLSKAVGCLGGFVTGPKSLIDWLFNNARTQVYSTALPAAVCAAACQAIEAIRKQTVSSKKLHQLADTLRQELSTREIEFSRESRGPIVPVMVRDAEAAIRASQRLQLDGFLVPAIRPPTVPAGTSRLRISLCVEHSEDEILRLVTSLREVL